MFMTTRLFSKEELTMGPYITTRVVNKIEHWPDQMDRQNRKYSSYKRSNALKIMTFKLVKKKINRE